MIKDEQYQELVNRIKSAMQRYKIESDKLNRPDEEQVSPYDRGQQTAYGRAYSTLGKILNSVPIKFLK